MTHTGTQAKYKNSGTGQSTGIEAATSGAKRLQSTARGHYPVSIHQMAPPERGNTHPIIQLTTLVHPERMKG